MPLIIFLSLSRWVRVEWDSGSTNSYRMGKEGQYDLRLADSSSTIASPDTETEKDDLVNENNYNFDSHPTKLLKNTCIKILQIISVGVGKHGDKMQTSSVMGVASMFRAVLGSKMRFLNLGLEHWTTFGFLRSISTSKTLSKFMTSRIWIDFQMNILDSLIISEQDVYKKVQCLRLLHATLVNWDENDVDRMQAVVEKLLHTLGRICLTCPNDLSLIQNPNDCKSRVLLSASYSGTIAEELIVLLRKLHTLPLWNGIISLYLSQKLCVAVDLFTESETETSLQNERFFVIGSFNVIGGCDPRPRLGMHLTYEGQRGTIARFTTKGKVMMNVHQTGEVKKLSVSLVPELSDAGAFSLSKLPINEMLLNSWSILMYGPGERTYQVTGNIEIPLLRSQQIQLSTLNATCVLFRHQSILRKILRQRSPGFIRYSSDDSISERDGDDEDDTNLTKNRSNSSNTSSEEQRRENQLLIQSILSRATQPSPLKAIYSFQDLSLAALNVSQMLASHVHAEISVPFSTLNRFVPQPIQPTMIHGVPIYNEMVDDLQTPSSEESNGRNGCKKQPSPLVVQIMEMGFSRKSVELAVKTLSK